MAGKPLCDRYRIWSQPLEAIVQGRMILRQQSSKEDSLRSYAERQSEPSFGSACLEGYQGGWLRTPLGTCQPSTSIGRSVYLGSEMTAGGCSRIASRNTACRYVNFDRSATAISWLRLKVCRTSLLTRSMAFGFFSKNHVAPDIDTPDVSPPAKISRLTVASISLGISMCQKRYARGEEGGMIVLERN